MGILSRIKRKLSKSINSFSGEYSQAAPEKTIPYETPDRNAEQKDVEVVMARLNRPAASSKSSEPTDDSTSKKTSGE